MPVTSQIGRLLGYHHDVIDALGDGQLAAGTEVFLGSRVGLDRGDGHPEKIAHDTTANVATIVMTSMAMSAALLS